MELVDIVLLLGNSSPIVEEIRKFTPFPRMYALSKKGTVRVYDISVEYKGDHSVLSTKKKVTLNGKWQVDTYEYWVGVNIGKANETTFHEQALFEGQSIWNRLRDAGFTTTMPSADTKYNTDANGKIKPMLAIPYNEKKIKFPCLCQPKYDGVRCTISKDSDGIHIISRKGKPYNIPHLAKWAEENWRILPLDGELYNHKELTFQEIISAVKKVSELTEKIKYVVYDRPIDCLTFDERWRGLVQDLRLFKYDTSPVYTSKVRLCHTLDDIMKFHEECVSWGYEGIIIRNLDGEYEYGFRSNDLIKYKHFDTDEFKIVDVEEATGRDAGTAVFVCSCEGGTFNVKPQGTRELRKSYYGDREKLVGKMVTVQYQGLSDDRKPRFPSALTLRDYE